MNKTELEKILNASCDSISLHDATMHAYEQINNSLRFTFSIGGYHFLTNSLEPYVDDIKDNLILTLRFEGVKELKTEFCDQFQLEGSEISSNSFEDGRFTMVMFDLDDPATISFAFDEFEWTVVGEFDIQSCEQWEKANRRGF